MKQLLLILLAAILSLSLMACSVVSNNDDPSKRPAQSTADSDNKTSDTDAETNGKTDKEIVYAYKMGNIVLTPGELLPLDKLPTPDSTAKVDSCAGDGYDNFYAFGNLEIVGHPTAEGEIIYSIYFFSNEVATPEGVKPGDPFTKATAVYGDNYTANNDTMIYTKDGVDLMFLVSDGNILSIEYMMVTE